MGRFVVIDRIGKLRGSYRTEAEANEAATDHTERWPNLAPTRVHPIGPALPGPAPVKTMGQVCAEAFWNDDSFGDEFANLGSGPRSDWSRAATAVIAAHEAGRGVAERVVRYALRGPDGKWWSHVKSEYVTDRTQRRLWEDRYEAEKWFEDGDTVVKVTITRRRRVVKS